MQGRIGSSNLEDFKEACVLYVLTSDDISHGKRWYVGSSKSIESSFSEHGRKEVALTSEGCWNVNVIQMCEDGRDMRTKELCKTLDLARRFGSSNVRGASFISEPFGRPLRALEKAVSHISNLCFDCAQNFNSEKCCKKRLRLFDAEEEDGKRRKKDEDKISDSRSDEVEIVNTSASVRLDQDTLRSHARDPKNKDTNMVYKDIYDGRKKKSKTFGELLENEQRFVKDWLQQRIDSSTEKPMCNWGTRAEFINWVVCLDETVIKTPKYFKDRSFQKVLAEAKQKQLEDYTRKYDERLD